MCSEIMDDFAVQVDNLSKCYRTYKHPRDRLLQALWGRDRHGKPKRFYSDFWALRELSFKLPRGQTLGVVGRNGSGKSTLLQLLCGTLEPTSGKVQVRGRVGALLELGSGFNPEFTGLENVYFNASLLGLSKAETDQRLDQILAFADIGDFTHQPVKTYSSGMAVRLAFAVQAHINPDVLVVDEALAVGDELFQKKCYAHLERLKERGTAVLLVSHSCPAIIQHCDKALLLHRGKARMLDEPARVTTTYQRLINASDAEWDQFFGDLTKKDKAQEGKELAPKSTEIYPSHGASIINARIEDERGKEIHSLPAGQPFSVIIEYLADQDLSQISFACNLARTTGQRITGQTYGRLNPINIAAGQRWEIAFSFSGGFWPDVYFLSASILNEKGLGRKYIHRIIDYKAIRITSDDKCSPIGACNLKAKEPALQSTDTQVPLPERDDTTESGKNC
jgi:lipopolysaccharide transport system ATP-binding protein